MLLGAIIRIHTDHKNLTYSTLVNDWVLWELNYIERFGPKYLHILEGEDMFSWLAQQDNHTPIETPSNKSNRTVNNVSFILDNNELLEYFLNLPDHNDIPFALDLTMIQSYGSNNYSTCYNILSSNLVILTYCHLKHYQMHYGKYVCQLNNSIMWPNGFTQLSTMLWTTLTTPNHGPTFISSMSAFCCRANHKELWLLSKIETTRATIWIFAATTSRSTIMGGSSRGPHWSMDGKVTKWNIQFYGTYLYWPCNYMGMQFENLWLSRYPSLVCCVHDRGTVFTGANFQRILQRFGIKDVTISVCNPQSNAICEQLHQSVGKAL
jgi:hypothetical protein